MRRGQMLSSAGLASDLPILLLGLGFHEAKHAFLAAVAMSVIQVATILSSAFHWVVGIFVPASLVAEVVVRQALLELPFGPEDHLCYYFERINSPSLQQIRPLIPHELE